jgi:hypothetical protein
MSRLPVLLSLLLVAPLAGAAPVEMSREEFRMYRYYLTALEHPEVKKMKPEARMGAIAKDGRFTLEKLKAAVEKGEVAGDLKAGCEEGIRSALSQGELKGGLGKVLADVSDPHAVVYVEWFNADLSQVEEEAALAAAKASSACPIATTIRVWAQDKGQPGTRVFQALITAERASRFRVEDVSDFADTRYLRAFEQVKHAGRGDDLSQEEQGVGGSGRP